MPPTRQQVHPRPARLLATALVSLAIILLAACASVKEPVTAFTPPAPPTQPTLAPEAAPRPKPAPGPASETIIRPTPPPAPIILPPAQAPVKAGAAAEPAGAKSFAAEVEAGLSRARLEGSNDDEFRFLPAAPAPANTPPPSPLQDAIITTSVKGKLAGLPGGGPAGTQVRTRGGDVHVVGPFSDPKEIARVAEAVFSVDGTVSATITTSIPR